MFGKQISLFLCIIVSFIGLIPAISSASGITVLAPTGGEKWLLSSTHDISWYDETGSIQARRVNIELEPYIACLYVSPPCAVPQVAPYTIATDVESNGTYPWTIPADLNSKYQTTNRIIVTTTDGALSGTSEVFSIAKTSSDESFYILPGKLQASVGEQVNTDLSIVGGTAPFSWEVYSGSLPAGLSLTFPQFNCFTTPCIPPKDTAYISGVPTSAGTSNFTLKVTDATQKEVYQSFIFSIVGGSKDTQIQVTSPAQGDTLLVGNKGTITWSPTQSGTTVDIDLWRYISCLHQTDAICSVAQPTPIRVATQTPDKGSFSWIVPSAGVELGGEYTIRVTNNTSLTAGESGVFKIEKAVDQKLNPGELVIGSSSTVFYITQDYKKYGFVSEQDFLGRGFSFSQVKTVDQSLLDPLPFVYTLPGTRTKISFWYSGQPAVYYLTEQSCKEVYPSMSTLSAWGVAFKDVLVLPSSETYQDCARNFVWMPYNALVKIEGNATVYAVRHGFRHAFNSYEALVDEGLSKNRIFTIPDYELQLYLEGAEIN